MTELETLVADIQRTGLDMVDAQLVASQLADDEKNFLASLMSELENQLEQSISESKLERIARGSTKFREYVQGRVLAQSEAQRAKVMYEAKKNLFDARRSEAA